MIPIPLNWTPSQDERVEAYLNVVLGSWEGTRCADGVALKGTRANCATFIWALLAELCHMRDLPEFTFQMGAVFHNAKPGLAAMKRFVDTFPIEPLDGEDVQPGDVIMAGLCHGGPSHLMMVGTRKNTVWHSTHAGVCFGGWVLPDDTQYQATYRCDISRWFR